MTDYNLTQVEAIARREIVDSGVSYRVYLDLRKGKEYSGYVETTFNVLIENPETTFLEFSGKEITDFTLNGTEGGKDQDGKIVNFQNGILKLENLVQGENILKIHFDNEYNNDGNGFHSYVDIEGKQYSYTNNEAHYACRIFPLFDQPDIRGTFELAVRVPNDWIVISNENEEIQKSSQNFVNEIGETTDAFLAHVSTLISQNLDEEDSTNFVKFFPTKALSTYLYTAIVGPYSVIDCPENLIHNNIPMKIYCREKMKKYVEATAKETFEINSYGIKSYEDLFKYPYPFSKCDTIFCPEYTCGAMENPGCITYSEQRYVFTHDPSASELTEYASTILHELAHMWFGDLVTMKWWNDLWLNESFADFVCYISMCDIQNLVSFEMYDGWLAMQLRKTFGYRADQANTTHPIACEVIDVESAFAIFDGITYAKGASSIRQLYSLIGRENFSKAMESYFNKFQWSNTTLEDLLSEMQSVLGDMGGEGAFDLKKFREDWLESTGLNTVSVEWDPKNTEEDAKIVLKQSAYHEAHPMLRFHKIQVALYGDGGELLEVKDVIVKNVESTEITYNGNLGVKAIIPNYGDLSFLRVRLDWDTLEYIKENYKNIENDLTRALIWRAIYDSVRCTDELRSFDYIMLAAEQIQHENKASILEFIDDFMKEVVQLTPESASKFFLPKLWKAIHDKLAETEEPELIKLLQKMVVFYAEGNKSIKTLAEWFEGKHEKFSSKTPTIEEKWQIAFLVNSSDEYSEEEKQKFIENVNDDTDRKNEWLLKLKAYNAQEAEREEIYKDVTSPTCSMSYHMIQFAIKGLNSTLLPIEKRSSYFEHFLNNFHEIFNSIKDEYGRVLVRFMIPNTDDIEPMVEKLEGSVDNIKSNYIKKILKRKIDDLKKMAKVKKFSKWHTEIIMEDGE